MSTEGWSAPWNADRYNMLDYCIIGNRKNNIKDVKAQPKTAINSDHSLPEIDIRVKLKKKDLKK